MPQVLSIPRVFDSVGYKPHEMQRSIHRAATRSRFRVVCAGRRTGKSTLGGHELTPRALEAHLRYEELDPHAKRMEYWIVGPEYSDSEKEFRALYNDLKQLEVPFDHPGTYYDVGGGNMHISLWGGRFQVHAKSAKYPKSLVGEGLHGVILAEAAKLKSTVWTKFIRPMLSDYNGYALLSSTPEGKNWFYDAWMNQQRGLPGWWSIRMPSWANPFVYPGGENDPEIMALRRELTPESFNQEIGADFTEFVGRVFKEFDENLHCRRLEYNPNWPTYAAVDYGWTNPFVWLVVQRDRWDNLYVIDEFYESHVRVDEAPGILEAQGKIYPNMREFFPDPASPGDTRILEDKLNMVSTGNPTGGELKERLRLIRKWLGINPELLHLPENSHLREPKLFVDPVKCPNFIREFNDYRYPKNREETSGNPSEVPMKKDDHTPEAMGRLMVGMFGENVDQGGVVVATSTMG